MVGTTEDGHVVVMQTAKATPASLKEQDSLAADSIVRTAICDLVGGSGTCHGYQTLVSREGDTAVAKYSGISQTTPTAGEKAPEITFRGSWIYVKGTGKFTNIAGGGAYQGRYISDTEYVVEWTGETR